MRAILQFNLDDIDDKIHHMACVKAEHMAICLHSLSMNHPSDVVRAAVIEEMELMNINLDELTQ